MSPRAEQALTRLARANALTLRVTSSRSSSPQSNKHRLSALSLWTCSAHVQGASLNPRSVITYAFRPGGWLGTYSVKAGIGRSCWQTNVNDSAHTNTHAVQIRRGGQRGTASQWKTRPNKLKPTQTHIHGSLPEYVHVLVCVWGWCACKRPEHV